MEGKGKGKGEEVFYFERPGPVNTEKALELGIARALELDIEHLVVPSITGASAWKALQLCRQRSAGLKVICVTSRSGS